MAGNAWPFINFAGLIVLGFAVAIVMLRNPARYGDPDSQPSRAMLLIEMAVALLMMGGCVVAILSLDQDNSLYQIGLGLNVIGIGIGVFWVARLIRKLKHAT